MQTKVIERGVLSLALQKAQDYKMLVKFRLTMTVVFSSVMAFLIALSGPVNWLAVFILAAGGAATMTWTLLSGLSRSLTRLFHREKQLETLNTTLESRVAERTRKLENL